MKPEVVNEIEIREVVGQDQRRGNTAHGMAFRRHTLASVDEPTFAIKEYPDYSGYLIAQ
jgi:hypothetical protein